MPSVPLTLATPDEARADVERVLAALRAAGGSADLEGRSDAARPGEWLAAPEGLLVVRAEDVPARPRAVEVAAVPARGEARDVLVAADPGVRSLHAVPGGTRVATTGERRRALLKAHRPDLKAVPAANGASPAELLRAGTVAAAVLSAQEARALGAAGEASEALDPIAWVPEPGAGSLVLLCREGDRPAKRAAAAVDDAASRAALAAEWAVRDGLRPRVAAPLGAYALPHGAWLRVWALVVSRDGTRAVRHDVTGSPDHPAAAGRALARALEERGADLLAGRGAA